MALNHHDFIMTKKALIQKSTGEVHALVSWTIRGRIIGIRRISSLPDKQN